MVCENGVPGPMSKKFNWEFYWSIWMHHEGSQSMIYLMQACFWDGVSVNGGKMYTHDHGQRKAASERHTCVCDRESHILKFCHTGQSHKTRAPPGGHCWVPQQSPLHTASSKLLKGTLNTHLSGWCSDQHHMSFSGISKYSHASISLETEASSNSSWTPNPPHPSMLVLTAERSVIIFVLNPNRLF